MRRGLSLLELVVVSAMMAVVVISSAMLLRSSQTAWEAHDSDHARLEAAHATLRHVVRHLRQAEAITAISSSGDTSGSISAQMPGGEIYVWDHSGTQVNFGVAAADSLLANNITQLSFAGYQADAATAAGSVDEVQFVRCTVQVILPRDTGGTRTISSRAWLRSW